jgi:hypothetical protein
VRLGPPGVLGPGVLGPGVRGGKAGGVEPEEERKEGEGGGRARGTEEGERTPVGGAGGFFLGGPEAEERTFGEGEEGSAGGFRTPLELCKLPYVEAARLGKSYVAGDAGGE